MIKLHSLSNYALFVGILLLFVIQLDKYKYQGLHEYTGNENIEIIESELSSKIFTIICHGYAGSKEMMRQLAFDISNAGSNAVIFDFIGHGSNSKKLVNNPTELSGTTQQLVDQLIGIIKFLKTKYICLYFLFFSRWLAFFLGFPHLFSCCQPNFFTVHLIGLRTQHG